MISERTPVLDWLAYSAWDARIHARPIDQDEPTPHELSLDRADTKKAGDAINATGHNPEGE